MEREYDVLETFVEEQRGLPRETGATSFLLRSEEFPKFPKSRGLSSKRFLVFVFPFEVYLNDGDSVVFEKALIEYERKIIPVKLLNYSEVRVYVKDSQQEAKFRKILEIPRRELDLLNFIKRSYTYDLGKQRTPILIVDKRNQNL